MKTGQVRRQIDNALEKLGQQIEQGASEQLLSYLAAMGRFHRYSWGNVLLILAQRRHASRVAGFGTWKKLGRHVKRGEKGIVILAPIVHRLAVVREKDDSTAEEDDELVRGFRPVYVFDVSQTDGKALPESSRVHGDPGEALERLKAFVAAQGIELGRLPAIADAEGVSRGGTILIQPGLAPAAAFSALVHELAHELLHWGEQEERPSITVQETEAEAVAFVVCQAVGLDAKTSSSDYIGVYQGNKETLAKSLGRIQQTAARIIEGVTVEEMGRVVALADKTTGLLAGKVA